jgi:hypothetical protein
VALCEEQAVVFPKNDSWDRMLEQAIMLLNGFCQEDRVRIGQPISDLQAKFTRALRNSELISYIDGVGDECCLLEWKTSPVRYPEEPRPTTGLLLLDDRH